MVFQLSRRALIKFELFICTNGTSTSTRMWNEKMGKNNESKRGEERERERERERESE